MIIISKKNVVLLHFRNNIMMEAVETIEDLRHKHDYCMGDGIIIKKNRKNGCTFETVSLKNFLPPIPEKWEADLKALKFAVTNKWKILIFYRQKGFFDMQKRL